MAHEILSVKLCELDKALSRLHGRIQLSETAGRERLRAEVESLRDECTEAELALRDKLQYSRANVLTGLSEFYQDAERLVRQAKEKIKRPSAGEQAEALNVEEKLLLAEYSLDFAVQTANRALLAALEAIEAQLAQQEQKERNLG
ncbi:MAG: hypothetical protein ACI3XJ_09390 [Oscillospiraceae bacterium]